MLTLSTADGMVTWVEELPFKDKKAMTSRNVKLIDITEDGSHLRFWFGMGVDITNDHLWHPTSLHDAVIENVGPQTPTAVYGAFDPYLAKELQVGSWDKYCQWQSKVLNYCAAEEGFDVIYSHIHNVDAMGHKFWHQQNQEPTHRKQQKERKHIRI